MSTLRTAKATSLTEVMEMKRGMVMEEESLTLGMGTNRITGREGGGIYIWICKKKKRKREVAKLS